MRSTALWQVEVRMKKEKPGVSWPTLEPSGSLAAPNWTAPTAAPTQAYPSSRHQVSPTP